MRAIARWSWVLGVAGLVIGAGPAFGQAPPPAGPAGTPPTAGPGAGAPGAGRRAPDLDKVFDRLDRDQSGEVSKQEYQAGARLRMPRRRGRQGGQGGQGGQGSRGGQGATPPGGSATSTPPAPGAGGPRGGGPRGGGPRAGGPRGRRPRPGMLPPFAFLDDDSNQSLTRDEFKSGLSDWHDALKAFRQADTDHDRKLSETEYQAGGFTAPFASLKGGDDFVDGKEYHDAVIAAHGKP